VDSTGKRDGGEKDRKTVKGGGRGDCARAREGKDLSRASGSSEVRSRTYHTGSIGVSGKREKLIKVLYMDPTERCDVTREFEGSEDLPSVGGSVLKLTFLLYSAMAI